MLEVFNFCFLMKTQIENQCDAVGPIKFYKIELEIARTSFAEFTRWLGAGLHCAILNKENPQGK